MGKQLKDNAKKIGLIADSHGDAATMAQGIEFLKKKECRKIFHLGDICDSNTPDVAEQCFVIIQKYNIQALLGNNDHIFCQSQDGMSALSDSACEYFRDLPLIRYHANAVMAHSLPFEKELGRACMIRNLGKDEIAYFMNTSEYDILFRGHSHTPQIVWLDHQRIHEKVLNPGISVKISRKKPCIVTCGAIFNRTCIIWSPQDQTISCHFVGDKAKIA